MIEQAPQITADPYKEPNWLLLSQFMIRAGFFPLISSNVALTTQAVNPYLLKHGLRYQGNLDEHFRFLGDKIRNGGFRTTFRGIIPFLLGSYEIELVNLALIQLQKIGVMPLDPKNLKKPRERILRNGNEQNQVVEKEEEANLEEADRLREQALQTPTTPLSLLKYFFCDFGTRVAGNLIFSPLDVVSVGQICDLGPEPEFETFIQRAVSIWEKEGFRGFYRGIKYKILESLICSATRTARWGLKAEWFGLNSFRTSFNLLILKMATLPLVGFARMRMISDADIDWFSTERGAASILNPNLQINMLVGYLGLLGVGWLLRGYVDFQHYDDGGFDFRINLRGRIRNRNGRQGA